MSSSKRDPDRASHSQYSSAMQTNPESERILYIRKRQACLEKCGLSKMVPSSLCPLQRETLTEPAIVSTVLLYRQSLSLKGSSITDKTGLLGKMGTYQNGPFVPLFSSKRDPDKASHSQYSSSMKTKSESDKTLNYRK